MWRWTSSWKHTTARSPRWGSHRAGERVSGSLLPSSPRPNTALGVQSVGVRAADTCTFPEWTSMEEEVLGSPEPAPNRSHFLQEEAKAQEEEGVPDEEGWVKVTRRGRRPVLPRTEAASLRVLERERRKRARKELLNFYAWQHRETKMERKAALEPCAQPWRVLQGCAMTGCSRPVSDAARLVPARSCRQPSGPPSPLTPVLRLPWLCFLA